MAFTMQVHPMVKDPSTGQMVVAKEIPYIRLVQGNNPPVYLQNGHAYWEDGTSAEPLPAWAEPLVASCNRKLLDKIGWSSPAPAAPPSPPVEPTPLLVMPIAPHPMQGPPATGSGLPIFPSSAETAPTESPFSGSSAAAEDPRKMQFMALRAWARRNGLEATTKMEILAEATAKGLMPPE